MWGKHNFNEEEVYLKWEALFHGIYNKERSVVKVSEVYRCLLLSMRLTYNKVLSEWTQKAKKERPEKATSQTAIQCHQPAQNVSKGRFEVKKQQTSRILGII